MTTGFPHVLLLFLYASSMQSIVTFGEYQLSIILVEISATKVQSSLVKWHEINIAEARKFSVRMSWQWNVIVLNVIFCALLTDVYVYSCEARAAVAPNERHKQNENFCVNSFRNNCYLRFACLWAANEFIRLLILYSIQHAMCYV